MTKVMESSPVQIAMCVLVLLDAGVVVAEILLDLHAMRSQQAAATGSLYHAMDFIWMQYPSDLIGFDDETVQMALGHLIHKYDFNKTNHHINHHVNHHDHTVDNDSIKRDVVSASFLTRHSQRWSDRIRRAVHSVHPISTGIRNFDRGIDNDRYIDRKSIQTIGGEQKDLSPPNKRATSTDDKQGMSGNTGTSQVNRSRVYKVYDPWSDKLLKITHLLHYTSIFILGIFVIQVMLRVIGLGSEFFRNRLEVFDAIIVIASFTLDLVFLDGIATNEGEDAIAIIIVFLLWRILRVINGFMVTAKKRHEFRIKLQKKACRRMEKKLEVMEDDICAKKKELQSLKNLCMTKGATERELIQCKPSRCALQTNQLNTSMGLSSIASLSMGFTMSMKGRFNNMPVAHLFPLGGATPLKSQVPPLKCQTPPLKCHKTHIGGLKKSLRRDISGQSSPNFYVTAPTPSTSPSPLKKSGLSTLKQVKMWRGSKNLSNELEMLPTSSFQDKKSEDDKIMTNDDKLKAASVTNLLESTKFDAPNSSRSEYFHMKNKKASGDATVQTQQPGRPVRVEYDADTNKYSVSSTRGCDDHGGHLRHTSNQQQQHIQPHKQQHIQPHKQQHNQRQMRRRKMFMSSHLLHERREDEDDDYDDEDDEEEKSRRTESIGSENFFSKEDGEVRTNLQFGGHQMKISSEKLQNSSDVSPNDEKKSLKAAKIEFLIGSSDSLPQSSHKSSQIQLGENLSSIHDGMFDGSTEGGCQKRSTEC